jgi:hypothetical protein
MRLNEISTVPVVLAKLGVVAHHEHINRADNIDIAVLFQMAQPKYRYLKDYLLSGLTIGGLFR